MVKIDPKKAKINCMFIVQLPFSHFTVPLKKKIKIQYIGILNKSYLPHDQFQKFFSSKVLFGVPDKKFGPAEEEDNSRVPRKILQLVERFR